MGRSTALVLSVAAAVAGAALQDLLSQSFFFESGTVFATDSWEYTQVRAARATDADVGLIMTPSSPPRSFTVDTWRAKTSLQSTRLGVEVARISFMQMSQARAAPASQPRRRPG